MEPFSRAPSEVARSSQLKRIFMKPPSKSDIENAIFKTQIRLNAVRRCFPKDSIGAELECHMYYLIKIRERYML